MGISIVVIFNKNYLKFQAELLEALKGNNALNNKRFEIFFCDDGSSDLSLESINNYIHDNNIKNIKVISTTPFGYAREYYSHGQIDGLKKVYQNIKSRDDIKNIYLLDSDDFYSSSYMEGNGKIKGYDVILNRVINFDVDGNQWETKKIRKISDNINIWPSVVVTSGIVISFSFLKKNCNSLFDVRFKDVWLDARINMLGVASSSKVIYADNIVYRRIHGSNDSRNTNYLRKLKKQCESSGFFELYVKDSIKSFNFRLFLLKIIRRIL